MAESGINEEKIERIRLLRQKISEAKPNISEQQLPMDAGTAVAGHLAPELGSDPIMKAMGQYDMRRMGVGSKRLNMAKIWFSWRATKEGGGNRFLKHLVTEDDNRSPSIDGLGRKQAIQMQGATVGGQVRFEELEKPNWITRNILNRDWKEEQERRVREERGY